MGYELFEDFEESLPDVVIYPTGGGTGLIGMWKAFGEMERLGWIKAGAARPRMYSVQAEGCAPLVRAFEDGAETMDYWEGAQTVAAGLRVPGAVGDFLMLRALRESGGGAVAVSDEELMADQNEMATHLGHLSLPGGRGHLERAQKARGPGAGGARRAHSALQHRLRPEVHRPS